MADAFAAKARKVLDAGHIIPGAVTPWSGGDAMETDRLAAHAVRDEAPVMPKARVTLGYDRMQFPLLRDHIVTSASEGDTERLMNALRATRRALSPATKVAEAAAAGIVDALLSLSDFEGPDAVREVATDAVRIILSHAAGRSVVSRPAGEDGDADGVADRLARLASLTQDPSQRVRLSALLALDALAGSPPGPAVLSGAEGLIEAVARAVARESAGRSKAAAEAEATALSCLARCAQSHDREGVTRCLECGVPVVAVTALARGRGRSTAEAARLLTALATPAEGKRNVLAAGATMSACEAVSGLREGQGDEADADALAVTLALLGTLTIDTAAKLDAFTAGAADAVVAVLREWRHPAVLLQACRATEVLSELPQARDAMLAAGADKALLDVRDAPRARDAVVRAAADAHEAVTWKP